jgi:hypothetical protein
MTRGIWGLRRAGTWVTLGNSDKSGRESVVVYMGNDAYAKDKLSWFFTDPQIVIDNENSVEVAIVDIEFGAMPADKEREGGPR